MTNQEAISILKIERDHMTPTVFTEPVEAMDMAISALQAQETCEDTVSRQAAIDAMTDKNITRNMDSVQDSELHRIKRAVHRILASLPPAQPEIIRCKYCKYNPSNPESANANCEIIYGITDQNGFCSRGERREDGSN